MTDDRRAPDDSRTDTQLWDLVASVPVPPAGDDFMTRLTARLAGEPGASAAAGGQGAVALPGALVRARRRFPTRLYIVAATVAAAAAVVAFAVLPALRGTETATAADMLASMNAAADGGAQAVRLRIVDGFVAAPQTSPIPGAIDEQTPRLKWKTTTDLALSTSGDFRASQVLGLPGTSHISADIGYDARRHELRGTGSSDDGVVVTQPASYADFSNMDLFYLYYQAQAASVRALLAEGDPAMPVTETVYLGRAAWQATLKDYCGPGGGETVVVDKATGLLLAKDRLYHGAKGDQLVSCLRVTSLDADPSLPAGWQVVPLLRRTTPTMRWNYFQNWGSRFGSPESVASRSWPTLPLIPEWVPAGYRRTDVATAVYDDPRPAHENDNSWHYSNVLVRRPHGSTPGVGIQKRLALRRCTQRVLVLFRRGFDTFTVTITPRSGERSVDDISVNSPGSRDAILTGGYLKGAKARTWITSATYTYQRTGGEVWSENSQGPTLLTYDDRSRIVISGALTRQELIDVANALRVYGDVEKPLP